MTASTVARPGRRYHELGFKTSQNYRVADAVTIPFGTFVALATSSFGTTDKRGYAIPWENSAGIQWLGIAEASPFNQSVTNTVVGDTGITGEPVPEVSVNTSPMILEKETVTSVAGQTDLGVDVFSLDNDTLRLASTTPSKVGVIEYWYSSTTADVLIFGRLAWLLL